MDRQDLLLTDVEIEAAVSEFCSVLEGHRTALREIAQAQLNKAIPLIEAEARQDTTFQLFEYCEDCWQELKKKWALVIKG